MLRSFLDGMKWREYARVFQREGADRDGEYFPSLQFTCTETSARRHLQPQPQCTPDRVRAPQFFAAASSPTRSPIPYGDDELYDLKLKVSSPFDAPTLKLMDVSLCARVKEVAAATETRSWGGDERRCVWGVEACGSRGQAIIRSEGEEGRWAMSIIRQGREGVANEEGIDDVERVAGCGFRRSDAGWLVDLEGRTAILTEQRVHQVLGVGVLVDLVGVEETEYNADAAAVLDGGRAAAAVDKAGQS